MNSNTTSHLNSFTRAYPSHHASTTHLHLERDNGAAENAATDGHVAGEGALLVDVGALDGLTGSLEAKTDVAHEAAAEALDLFSKKHVCAEKTVSEKR